MIDLTWCGPMDITGYGCAARAYISALYKTDKVDLKVKNSSRVPIPAGAVPEDEILLIRRLLDKQINMGTTTFVCQTIAEQFPYEQFNRNIGYTVFETETLHKRKAAICNTMDEIWCPSHFNKEGFEKGGVSVPIKVIPHICDPLEGVKPIKPTGAKSTNFLYAAELNWRKGWDIAVRSFCNTFKDDDDVSLTLKVHAQLGNIPVQKIHEMIKNVRKECQYNPTILCIAEKLPIEQLAGLMMGADAFVLPSRGESWGLTLSEAMSYGTPTIGPNWGGNLEYMTQDNSYLIDINGLVNVTNQEALYRDRAYIGQKLCEPSAEHLGEIMQEIVKDKAEAQVKGQKAKENMKRFAPDKVATMILTELG